MSCFDLRVVWLFNIIYLKLWLKFNDTGLIVFFNHIFK